MITTNYTYICGRFKNLEPINQSKIIVLNSYEHSIQIHIKIDFYMYYIQRDYISLLQSLIYNYCTKQFDIVELPSFDIKNNDFIFETYNVYQIFMKKSDIIKFKFLW